MLLQKTDRSIIYVTNGLEFKFSKVHKSEDNRIGIDFTIKLLDGKIVETIPIIDFFYPTGFDVSNPYLSRIIEILINKAEGYLLTDKFLKYLNPKRGGLISSDICDLSKMEYDWGQFRIKAEKNNNITFIEEKGFNHHLAHLKGVIDQEKKRIEHRNEINNNI